MRTSRSFWKSFLRKQNCWACALSARDHGLTTGQTADKKSDFGNLLGDYEFLAKALEKRDKRVNEKSLERRRKDDNWFEPVEKVYWELEKEYGIKLAQLDYGTLAGKQWRGELLVRLNELSGLTYREIAQLVKFRDIKLHSLAKLYKDARKG